jgi:DnaJ-class molecular chaperone
MTRGNSCDHEKRSLTMFSCRSCRFVALFLLAILIPSFVQANIPNSNHNSRVSTNGTPYQVLGVEKNASSEEIKRRYRQLCLKYHPDKNVNLSEKERDLAEETFKQVQAANTQIGKPDARKTYDSQQ